jgi:hypothetical protein
LTTKGDTLKEIFRSTVIASLLLFAGGVELFAEKSMVEIGLNPMVELNFKTKSDILALRKAYVMRYPKLVNGKYTPSEEVFGGIGDGKSWIGIVGYSYYGQGEKIIEGPAEESRFIANPFLLIGVDDPRRAPVAQYPELRESLPPKAIYPAPKRLRWSSDGTSGTVTYGLADFLDDSKRYQQPAVDGTMMFTAYNARDIGFPYCMADAAASRNVVFKGLDKNVLQISQFLHCGASSGYPGGSNNMSPDVPELWFNYTQLPARAVFKLWRARPAGAAQKPDMVFTVELEDQ